MSHVRKPKLIEQRLQQHARYVVANPASVQGIWRQHFESLCDLLPSEQMNTPDAPQNETAAQQIRMPEEPQNTTDIQQPRTPKAPQNKTTTQPKRLHVDLGCGKGLWTTQAASANPDALFVGVDMERMCISFAAERAGLHHLPNTLFALDLASTVDESFAAGEVDVLHINFPTPFPRLKDAPQRITDARRLVAYRYMLGEQGLLCFKTDSQFMFQFTLDQLQHAGYTILWQTCDLRTEYASHPFTGCGNITQAITCGRTLAQLAAEGPLPTDFIESAYEHKLVAKGAKLHALHAIPGPAPAQWQPNDFVSLFNYLPSNLENIDYVPLGMEDAIANMRNRQRNARAKAARHSTSAE